MSAPCQSITRFAIKSPTGIVPKPIRDGADYSYPGKPLKGTWWRCFPRTAKEIFWLQNLQPHHDKFAPAYGDGILVHDRNFPL